jgi:hypothetical protein
MCTNADNPSAILQLPQMSQVMQPRIISPGHQFALAPATPPQLFALNGQQRFVPNTLPFYARGYSPYQLLGVSSQGYPGRGGRGFKNFGGGRGRGFAPGFGRGGIDSVLNQRYETGNERGPRAQRVRFGQAGGADEELSLPGGREQFNQADFDVAPPAAKFFVIKSYSEDDVHKSIKYGVWASTPNGNKRLQGAYREAQAEELRSRVFLLYSVNASGQFCGVAEMVSWIFFRRILVCVNLSVHAMPRNSRCSDKFENVFKEVMGGAFYIHRSQLERGSRDLLPKLVSRNLSEFVSASRQLEG